MKNEKRKTKNNAQEAVFKSQINRLCPQIEELAMTLKMASFTASY
jgi:hypothetical protein